MHPHPIIPINQQITTKNTIKSGDSGTIVKVAADDNVLGSYSRAQYISNKASRC